MGTCVSKWIKGMPMDKVESLWKNLTVLPKDTESIVHKHTVVSLTSDLFHTKKRTQFECSWSEQLT